MNKFFFILLFFVSIRGTAQNLAPDRPAVPEVQIGHYMLASSAEYPALQTSGVGPCIVLTLYDQRARQGALLHVSGPVNIKSAVQQVLKDFARRGSYASGLSAQLLGGWDDSLGAINGMHHESTRIVNQVLAELARYQIRVDKNITLTTRADLDKGAPLILDLELDLYTGEVYRFRPQGLSPGGVIGIPLPTAVSSWAYSI